MLADVGALGLSLGVAYVAQRPATAERTFGLLRLEILAALVNGAALLAISIGVAVEALHRLRNPAPVQGALLVAVAALGLIATSRGLPSFPRGTTPRSIDGGPIFTCLTAPSPPSGRS